MNTNTQSPISSGREFESKILGETLLFTMDPAAQIPYLSFAKSLEHAEENAIAKLRAGTWNPRSPPTMTALELQQAVQGMLRIKGFSHVELVNALGTALDIHWGVDCYFRLPGTQIIVTVDITMNLDKIRAGRMKTDLFLTPLDLSSGLFLSIFAQRVANLLRKRYKRFQHERPPDVFHTRRLV